MHFLRWLKQLVEPRSKDDDSRRREFILNVLLISSTVVASAALFIVVDRFFSLGSAYYGEPPLLAVLQVAIFAGLWVLSRKGFFVPAAYALVIIFLLIALFALFEWGILMPQGVLLLALVLIMSSILLGTRAGAILTFIASAMLILLGVLQQSGKITFDATWMKAPGGLTDAVGLSLTLAVITMVSWLSNREIENFNLRLLNKVNQATDQLQDANKKLKVLDHTKDEFISLASHQLGTPLTAIIGYVSMTLDNDEENMKPDQKQFLAYALEAAESMGAISRDLLNVSRISSGRFIIQRQLTNLTAMVEQELDQLRPAAERKGLKLAFVPPSPSLPELNVDESKTRQVVMNLIDNAICYTPTGTILVELRRIGGSINFTVSDAGMGVPKSEQSKLFAKFYRAENAKIARPDGTGLGLYLAKRVIEDQGGSIIFHSEEGKGSTFGFSMPLAN